MHDIKIPDPGGPPGKKQEFEVMHLGAPMHSREAAGHEPSEKVRVRFEKFVQLVATHNFEEVMRKHAAEDIILSTNLLTDLANAHEEAPQENRALPVIFIVGIILGVIITYLVVRF